MMMMIMMMITTTTSYKVQNYTDLVNTSLPTTTDVINDFVSSAHVALKTATAIR